MRVQEGRVVFVIKTDTDDFYFECATKDHKDAWLVALEHVLVKTRSRVRSNAAFDSCNVAPPSEQSMVQVTDTLELPLHGANETTIALETGNVVTVVCVVCRATLRCIAIAQYVLCPECKCLTPLENNTTKATGGVGLGLLSTYDQSFRVSTS